MTSCCACDDETFPPEPEIVAGLSRLPRQVLGFPEYRHAMLAQVRSHAPLADWRAREGDDLGLMMLEWWAYVLDVVAFYDGEIAQNLYLRTATDPGALRRLVNLIGYHLRPGIAAEAYLAAVADPGPPTVVPKGTAFRSGAFGGESPQVFESDADVTISAYTNKWVLAPVQRNLAEAGDRLLFDIPSLRLTRGALAVSSIGGTTAIATVTAINAIRAVDGKPYAEVITDPVITIPAGTDVTTVVTRMPTASAGINRFAATPVTATTILLDAIYPQLGGGQDVVLTGASAPELHTLQSVTITTATPPTGSNLPQLPATQLTLTASLATAWTSDSSLRVQFQLVDAGRVVRPAEVRVDRSDLNPSAPLAGVVELLESPAAGPFLLLDRDKTGAEVDGTVQATASGQGTLVPSSSTVPFDAPLVPPIDVYGNILHVVRGETVAHEVLGSGDASVAFPAFKLKKKPLTYTAQGSAPDGRRSSLSVRVNGLLWREVPSFFGVDPEDTVFIVRQDENGDSFVTFLKLPSGVDNVTASYRFGAGLARPPANSITQIVRPVKGLARVLSPVAAFGGGDADSIDDIRKNAPASALTLGRAVSLADFEALARGFGAVNVSAGWAWDPPRQRAVVKLWFISDQGDIAQSLRSFLLAQADPNVPLVVAPARSIPTRVVLDVVTDSAYESADVQTKLVAAFTDPESGLFAHENAPIGGTIFRSAIFAAASAIAGVAAINGMTVNGDAAPAALSADEGTFLDFLPFANT
jgi:hypothetical protein